MVLPVFSEPKRSRNTTGKANVKTGRRRVAPVALLLVAELMGGHRHRVHPPTSADVSSR